MKYHKDYFMNNNITLHSYEQGINQYISGTANETNGVVKDWIDQFLSLLPTNAQIIEIGSAFGRDAKYIESCGFSVDRTDATIGFVHLLQNEGHLVHKFNILTDDFSSPYDLVFANAVFLHFNHEELIGVLKKVEANLNSHGILAFSVKHGTGDEWTNEKVGNPRYFCYWQKETLQSLLESLNFEVVYLSQDDKFLQITARKK